LTVDHFKLAGRHGPVNRSPGTVSIRSRPVASIHTMPIEKLVLQISDSSAGPVLRVGKSPAGPSDPVPFQEPLDDEALATVARAVVGHPGRSLLRHLLSLGRSEPQADLLRIGWKLTEAVFQRPVADAFLSSLGPEGARRESPLRIEIRIDRTLPDAAQLQALPWELLLHPRLGSPLALSPWTPVVRYLEVPRAEGRPPRPEKLSILVVAPRPLDAPRLDLDRELAALQGAWTGSDRVELAVLETPTFDALHEELVRRRIDVLHFMGHGRFDPDEERGVLLFEDQLRRSDPVDAELLASDVEPWARNLRLVVLNACGTGAGAAGVPVGRLSLRPGSGPRLESASDGWMESASLPRRASGVAAALVGAGVPAVVAMQLPVSDAAALVISRALYRSLATGATIDVAVAEARAAVRRSIRGSGEWMTPALFLRMDDGHLFAPAAAPGSTAEETDDKPRRGARWASAARAAAAAAAVLAAAFLVFGVPHGGGERAGTPESARPDASIAAVRLVGAPEGAAGGGENAPLQDEEPAEDAGREPDAAPEPPPPTAPLTVSDGETVSLAGLAATVSVEFLSIDGEATVRLTVAPDAGELVPLPVLGPQDFDVPAGDRTLRIQVLRVDFRKKTVTLKALLSD